MNLSNSSCSLESATLSAVQVTFYSLFFVLGLGGNLFALWVFLFLHSRRNSVRVFLINCAVADLVLLACLPFRVLYHARGNHWDLTPVACRIVGSTFYCNMYISIALLSFISLDRYLRMRGRSRAPRGVWLKPCGYRTPWVVCGVLWGLVLILCVMLVVKSEKNKTQKCFEYKQVKIVIAYFNFVIVALFWLVFIMLIVSYSKIASKLLQASQQKPDLPNSHKYRVTAKKSFFVPFLFTVCFGPYHVFRPIYIQSQLSSNLTCDYKRLMDHTNEITLLLSVFNSCLDPVMYFLLSGSIRRTALRVLGSRLRHHFPGLEDVTFNSSTMEYRRPSAPLALPDHVLNDRSLTPRTSICVVSSLRRTRGAMLPPGGRQKSASQMLT